MGRTASTPQEYLKSLIDSLKRFRSRFSKLTLLRTRLRIGTQVQVAFFKTTLGF